MIKSLYKTLLPGLVAVVLLGSVAFSVNTPVASAQESEQQIAEMIKQLQAQIEGRGYHVEIFNMDVSDSGPRGDHGEFDIDFRITAFTEDVFIPNSTARGRGSVGVIYEVVENGGRVVTTGQTMANLDSSVRRDGSRYRVNKGESVDFELVVEYQPEYTGTYTVRLRTVRPEGDVTTRMPDRDDRFEVKFITLKGSREITGQTGQESNDATIQRLQQQLQALIAQLTQMLANLQGTLNSLTMTVYPYNNSTDTFEARFDAGQSNTYSHYEIDWGEGDNSQQTVRSRVATVCNSQWTCTAPPGMIHTYVKSGMQVSSKQAIGMLQAEDGNISMCHFEIHSVASGLTKSLNPSLWIGR